MSGSDSLLSGYRGAAWYALGITVIPDLAEQVAPADLTGPLNRVTMD
jgi:hypothetical protein